MEENKMETRTRGGGWLAAFCAAVLLTVFTGGARAESPDYGNSISTATAVNSNSSTAGELSPAGDWDYFRIDVPFSGTLTVSTTGSTDTYGYLKDAGGADLASNDDSGSLNFRISRDVAAGTYYVAVRHYSGSGTGSYTLVSQFTAAPDDHGNSISAATAVNPNSSTAGVISYAGDWDYFRIDVPSSGGTLTLSTTGSTDTYGYLKDSSGADLASNDDYGGNLNFRISQEVAAGTYYVAVRHYSSSGTGSYALVSQLTLPDDHGNSVSTATAITPNSSTAGAIDYAGDWDYFRIDVPSRGILTVYTTGSTDTYGYLKDSDGYDWASNDDFSNLNFRISSQYVEAGTYYIAVRHYSGSGTGAYTLVSELIESDDHGKDINSATYIDPNSSTAGVISYAGDWDYFGIYVPSNGTLTVRTTGTTDTYGYLKDGSGADLASNDDYGSLNFRISRDVTEGTYYYVAVRHYSGSGTGGYTLVSQFVAAPVDDHGNDPSSATWIDPNSSTAGVINAAGDHDYFGMYVPSNGTLTLSTTGSTDTYGCLKDSNGTDIACNDDSGSLNFRISRDVAAGYYYVDVRHYSSSGTGGYTLVSQFAPTDDHGNDISTATEFFYADSYLYVSSSSIDGAINSAGDWDYFYIYVPSSGTLTVSTSGSTDTYGYLKYGDGTDLASNDDYGGSRNFFISQYVYGGTYYVAVRHYNSSSGTGSYTLGAEFYPDGFMAVSTQGGSSK